MPMPQRRCRRYAVTIGRFLLRRKTPAFALACASLIFLPVINAGAVPSFARQTGQACSECHVGAFGPQLKPYGRDFKLYGYVASDGSTGHFPPLAMAAQGSLTHTQKDQAAGPAPNTRFGQNKSNDNLEVDQINLFYAGRITPGIGAFINTTYDGAADRFAWDNIDIRHAHAGVILGKPYVVGVTVNNQPTAQDLWNSTPAWGFPYNTSGVAPTPAAATLIDGALGQAVLGAGIYSMWDRWVYLEVDAYQGLGKNTLTTVGIPTQDADKFDRLMPYWRAAIQHQFGAHNFEIGTYGIQADILPGGDESTGLTDRKLDTAFDANYQWAIAPEHFLSAHATYIHEKLDLHASSLLAGSNPSDRLNTARADLSYSYKDTLIPTAQYFQTWGSDDPSYWGTANGNPGSAGYMLELAYVPFGKADSIVRFSNLRLSVQYTAYTRFDGTAQGASANNTLMLHLWAASSLW